MYYLEDSVYTNREIKGKLILQKLHTAFPSEALSFGSDLPWLKTTGILLLTSMALALVLLGYGVSWYIKYLPLT